LQTPNLEVAAVNDLGEQCSESPHAACFDFIAECTPFSKII
jgi:hypothetical protein